MQRVVDALVAGVTLPDQATIVEHTDRRAAEVVSAELDPAVGLYPPAQGWEPIVEGSRREGSRRCKVARIIAAGDGPRIFRPTSALSGTGRFPGAPVRPGELVAHSSPDLALSSASE